jgi:hypothetical protein
MGQRTLTTAAVSTGNVDNGSLRITGRNSLVFYDRTLKVLPNRDSGLKLNDLRGPTESQ